MRGRFCRPLLFSHTPLQPNTSFHIDIPRLIGFLNFDVLGKLVKCFWPAAQKLQRHKYNVWFPLAKLGCFSINLEALNLYWTYQEILLSILQNALDRKSEVFFWGWWGEGGSSQTIGTPTRLSWQHAWNRAVLCSLFSLEADQTLISPAHTNTNQANFQMIVYLTSLLCLSPPSQ